MADEKKDVVVETKVEETVVDPIAAKDEVIAKLSKDLDNYKHVALKRLGKNPGDPDFVAGVDEKTGLTIEETIKKTLIEGEVAKVINDKDETARKLFKENAELRLALKNRPESALGGGGSGDSVVVKDNVFSEAQIQTLTATATRLKVDPEKFIEKAKANILKGR